MSFRIRGQSDDGIDHSDSGGGYGGGQELKPGRPYTISLTPRHRATPRAVLGVVVFTRSD